MTEKCTLVILFVILSEAKNLFFHFLKEETLRLYSLRVTKKESGKSTFSIKIFEGGLT